MKNIVALRSYGDYVVLLSCIMTSSNMHNYKIYASEHLKSIHDSLLQHNNFELEIEFIDLEIKTGILPLFTNKHFFTIGNITTLVSLNLFLNKHKLSGNYLLEQKKRTWLINIFTGVKFNYINKYSLNIYSTYFNFFNGKQKNNTLFSKDNINPKKILIFSDSRKKEKELPIELVKKIKNGLNNKNTEIAKFGKEVNHYNKEGVIYYDNFNQLSQLIKKSDFIISSDSLPAHLAYYFNIPHWIIYNKKINTEWLTPYCMENNTYSLFNNVDILLNYVNVELC